MGNKREKRPLALPMTKARIALRRRGLRSEPTCSLRHEDRTARSPLHHFVALGRTRQAKTSGRP